ncbi:hypothetical protein [Siccirubricoccus deserti]|uniref:Uncharacterized protein n=1 Tax=Siccirubricoccus deserti TaxID=2013562 RepID=A0A9X0R442_9PROT|nr:hypothetical protein [Siccirubricoccus deserti]MBC4019099.1 hypothetical protein [Siccirubricoccus deserti]
MTATLVVALEVARALHAGDPASQLLRTIRDAGAQLYPMPAFAPGEPGERTFLIEAPPGSEAALCAKLLRMRGVEACYVKPQDAPP